MADVEGKPDKIERVENSVATTDESDQNSSSSSSPLIIIVFAGYRRLGLDCQRQTALMPKQKLIHVAREGVGAAEEMLLVKPAFLNVSVLVLVSIRLARLKCEDKRSSGINLRFLCAIR